LKPVTHHLIPFTLDRVQSIRINREITLAEGLIYAVGKGHKKKKGATTGTTRTTKKRNLKPKIVLDTQAQKQLEGLDAATRAFLEKAMK
jgi:hypothetical protein